MLRMAPHFWNLCLLTLKNVKVACEVINDLVEHSDCSEASKNHVKNRIRTEKEVRAKLMQKREEILKMREDLVVLEVNKKKDAF